MPTSLSRMGVLTKGFSFTTGDIVLGGAVECDVDTDAEEGAGGDRVKSSCSPIMGRLASVDCVEKGMAEELKLYLSIV